MSLKLLFTVVCDDIRQEDNKKLILVGVYNNVITFQRAAMPVPQGAVPKFVLPQLCFLRRWELSNDPVDLKTEIIGPEGALPFSIPTQLRPHTEFDYAQEVFKLAGFVLSPGKYTIVTTIAADPSQKYESSFWVKEV